LAEPDFSYQKTVSPGRMFRLIRFSTGGRCSSGKPDGQILDRQNGFRMSSKIARLEPASASLSPFLEAAVQTTREVSPAG